MACNCEDCRRDRIRSRVMGCVTLLPLLILIPLVAFVVRLWLGGHLPIDWTR